MEDVFTFALCNFSSQQKRRKELQLLHHRFKGFTQPVLPNQWKIMNWIRFGFFLGGPKQNATTWKSIKTVLETESKVTLYFAWGQLLRKVNDLKNTFMNEGIKAIWYHPIWQVINLPSRQINVFFNFIKNMSRKNISRWDLSNSLAKSVCRNPSQLRPTGWSWAARSSRGTKRDTSATQATLVLTFKQVKTSFTNYQPRWPLNLKVFFILKKK